MTPPGSMARARSYTSKVAPRPDQLAALGQYKNMFIQQKLAMFRLAPWGVLATSDAPLQGEPGYFEWDAIRMPKGPGGQYGSNLTASYMGIAPSSKNPDAAFKVLAWLTNRDASILQCFNAGMCGPRPDVLTDDRVKQSKYVQTVNSTITEAKLPRYTANGRDSEAVAALGKEFDKLINDQAKPDQSFFDNMNKLVQDVLDKPAALPACPRAQDWASGWTPRSRAPRGHAAAVRRACRECVLPGPRRRGPSPGGRP